MYVAHCVLLLLISGALGAQFPWLPVCHHGDPHPLPCGGLQSTTCPTGFDCVFTTTVADGVGVCCPSAPTTTEIPTTTPEAPTSTVEPTTVKPTAQFPWVPVCRNGDPHQIPGPHGVMINLPCGGLFGLSCPTGFECVVTATGAFRVGFCCPSEQFPWVPVCRHGDPHQNPGPHGVMINLQCGGLPGFPCPTGFDCVVTATGAYRFGICCPSAPEVPTTIPER